MCPLLLEISFSLGRKHGNLVNKDIDIVVGYSIHISTNTLNNAFNYLVEIVVF